MTQYLGKYTMPYNPMQEQRIEFTQEELMQATEAIKVKSAPGSDQIPSEAKKVVEETMPNTILKMLNDLLKNFPDIHDSGHKYNCDHRKEKRQKKVILITLDNKTPSTRLVGYYHV